MDWDLEMQRALEADGEKLRQLTGEDHGPYFLGETEVYVPCPACDGAGEWDEGPLAASSGATEPEYRQVFCPHCKGTGRVIFDETIQPEERADDFEDAGYVAALSKVQP
jgi:hypothetical protein